jgi:hypothetical protein
MEILAASARSGDEDSWSPSLSNNGNSEMEQFVEALLRSGARASGAMQKGLDDLASSGSGLGAFNPFVWIEMATQVIIATITRPNRPPEFDKPTPQSPRALSRLISPPRGRGDNPFRVPAPPAATKPAPTLAGESAVRPEALQAMIDQDANFLMFSMPDNLGTSLAITDSGTRDNGNLIGLNVNAALHRFNISTSAATNCAPLTAGNTVGERAGSCKWRWLFMPDNFVQMPGEEPPRTPMMLDTPQRFAMIDGLFKFGDGDDGFRGSGGGQTAPVVLRGRRQLYITAIGTLSEGFGKFKDLEDGFFIYCGILNPEVGFQGSVTLRLADPRGILQTTDPLPPLQAEHNPEQGVTWLTIRAQAVPSASMVSKSAQDGQPGMILQQEAHLLDMDFTPSNPGGLECAIGVRQAIGIVTSHIAFDPHIAAGTPNDPLPFAVWREFSFVDSLKNPVGGFTAGSSDGIALVTDVSGTKAYRFGGTGRILNGSGRFEGMSGSITENTLAVLDPWVSSSVFILRIDDPLERFSARDGIWRDIPVSEVVGPTQ